MERLRFRPWGKSRQDKGKEGERTVPVDKSLLSPVYSPSCLQLALSTLLLFSCWVMSNSLRPCQAPLSFTISRSLLRFMSVELVMPSNHLIHCHPLLLLPSDLSQHQGLFQWVSSLDQVAKVYCPFYYQYPSMFLLRLCTSSCMEEFKQSYLCFLQKQSPYKNMRDLAAAHLSCPDIILHALSCPVHADGSLVVCTGPLHHFFLLSW